MPHNGLPKAERLRLEKEISELFRSGKRLYIFPLVLKYSIVHEPRVPPVKFSVSVPKKKIKLAVQRNRIKRKIREFYRHHKHLLIETAIQRNIRINLMFIFSSDDPKHVDHAEKKVIKLLNKLNDVLIQH